MSKRVRVLALVVGVIALVGILGVGAAFAADPTPTPTNYYDTFVGKVAKILGVDQSKVESAINQARSEMIDDAVKAGRLSKEQGDWMKQRIQQAQQGGFGPGLGPGFGPRGGRFGGPFGGPWQGTPPAAPSR